MLTPWQVFRWWFITGKHVCSDLWVCVSGLAWILMYYIYFMTKIQTYLNINCNEFNGAHVLWEIPSLEVSTTTADKSHSQSLVGNPQICDGLALPRNDGHIYACSGSHIKHVLKSLVFSSSDVHSFLGILKSKECKWDWK